MKKTVTKSVVVLLMTALALSLNGCGADTKTVEETSLTAQHNAAAEPADIDAAGNQVLYNQFDIRITANGLEHRGTADPVILITVENSTEMDLTVQVKSISVNGFMQECVMNTSVPAGELIDSQITLVNDSLNRCGIEKIAEADIALHVYDDATWSTIYDSEPVTFMVKGMEKHVQTYDDNGEILFDENRIKIVSRGLSEIDGLFGPQIMLYIENNTEKDITVQAHDALINDTAVEPFLSAEVTAGKKTVYPLAFMSEQLAENNIKTMDSLETAFNIFDSSWNTIADTDSITIQLN